MKRKFLALLCIVSLLALVFASCDMFNKNDDDVCEHTYSENWSTSSTEHWHAATCEHAELKKDVASHTDADVDGKCDVCGYEVGHVHTFADTWTFDETNHWKSATCPHTEEKGELAAHTDSDYNGSCDVCSSHVHVVNLSGVCTVCGEKVSDADANNFDSVISTLVSNSGRVNGGSIATYDVITDRELEDGQINKYYAISESEVEYILGSAAAYYKVYTHAVNGGYEFTDIQESWYELLANGDVFGVYQLETQDGLSDIMLDSATADYLTGYEIFVSNLTNARGPENLLASLYELSQSAFASGYTSSIVDGVYTFSFGYLSVNGDTGEGEGNAVDYFEVIVAFEASETGVLTALAIECDCYTNSIADELDVDYVYDQSTNSITMKEDAVADIYVIVFSQTEGARNYVSEHPKSEFMPEDFDLFLDEECTTELGETVTVTEGDSFYLYFGNFTPADINGAFMADTYVCNSEDFYSWAYGNSIGFVCNNVGTYDVEFTLAGKTVYFTLVVEVYSSTGGDQPDDTVKAEITDTYSWEVDYVTFTAPADGDYTFTIEAGVFLGAMGQSDSAPWADYYNTDRENNPVGGSKTVSLRAGETYTFTVSSTTKGVYYIPYTVADYTGDFPGADSGNGGSSVEVTTTITSGSNNVVFSEEEIANGTATKILTVEHTGKYTFKGDLFVSSIVDSEGNTVERGSDYKYSLVAGETYSVTFGMFSIFGTPALSPVPLTVEGSDIQGGGNGGNNSDVTVVTGPYTGTDYFGTSPLVVVIDETTVTFNYTHPLMGTSSIVATYAIVDGQVVLYDENGSELHPLAGSLTIDANGVPTAASYNGTDYTLVAGGSTGGNTSGGGDSGNGADNEITTIPVTWTFDGAHDVYYSFTATEDTVLVITYQEGAFVSITGGEWDKDEANLTYTLSVAAGETVEINPWATTPGVTYTYTVNYAA